MESAACKFDTLVFKSFVDVVHIIVPHKASAV